MRVLTLALLGTTLLGASTTATTLSAQAPATQAPAAQPGLRGGGRGMRALFNGITLTDAQQAQLKTVRERYRGQRAALRKEVGAQRGANRADGTRPDSAARAAVRGRMTDLQQREMADVRGVLTPAQQTTFDKNVTEMRARGAERRSAWAKGGARGPRGRRAAGGNGRGA